MPIQMTYRGARSGVWEEATGCLVEDDGRGVDDGDVDRGQAALVGEDEGDAGQVTDESGDAAADPEDEVTGVAGNQIGRGSSGSEAVVEHGAEELRIGLVDHRGVPDDATASRARTTSIAVRVHGPVGAWHAEVGS